MHRHYIKEIHDDYIVSIYGAKHYYKDNYMYKEVSSNGVVYFRDKDGFLHNEDGPAYISKNGSYIYSINGVHLTLEKFNELTKNKKNFSS